MTPSAKVQTAPVGRARLPGTTGLGVIVGLHAMLTVVRPGVVTAAGQVAVTAIAVALLVGRGPSRTRAAHAEPAVATALGILLLSATNAGLVEARTTTAGLALTLLAYPLLGLALFRRANEVRVVRATDLFVEAVIAGTAAAMALESGLTAQAGVTVFAGVPSVLLGVDVALVVVAIRALAGAPIRPNPVASSGVAAVALGGAHLLSALAATGVATTGLAAEVIVVVAFGALAFTEVADVRDPRSEPSRDEPTHFSPGHALAVGAAIVVAPTFLVIGHDPSPGVVGGLAVVSIVVGVHLVGLLLERTRGEHRATHDPLTDLPNRVLLMDRLERAIAHAKRSNGPVGLIYIDLDRFKAVNDGLGHQVGDELLCATADRLAEAARDEDTVARLGGDEFAVLLPHLREPDDVRVVAQRLLEAMDQSVAVNGELLRNPASVGVAVYPTDGETPTELLAAADAAMYKAKGDGGARLEMFNREMAATVAAVSEIETQLVRAIERDELEMHYQPIVDLATGRTIGAEALVRWNHPVRGFVSPGDFIPIAEQSDLIVDLGEWTFDAVSQEIANLARRGFGDCSISVNVSARHFRHDLVSAVTRSLRTAGAKPQNLTVELTESTAVQDLDSVAAALHDLRQLGVKAAIDDFGTGYCGLRYLVDLPVSSLKIDRSFVVAMTPESAAIVAGTIAMGRALGLTVVAEGVETEEQLRLVTKGGCDRVQGYATGRPMPASDFLDRLLDEQASGPAHVGDGPRLVQLAN